MDMVGKEMFVLKKNRIRKIGFCLQYVSLIVSNYKKYYTFKSVWNAREHFLCWKTFLIRKNNLFSKYSLFTFKNCLFCPDTQLEEKWRKSYSCFILIQSESDLEFVSIQDVSENIFYYSGKKFKENYN